MAFQSSGAEITTIDHHRLARSIQMSNSTGTFLRDCTFVFHSTGSDVGLRYLPVCPLTDAMDLVGKLEDLKGVF